MTGTRFPRTDTEDNPSEFRAPRVHDGQLHQTIGPGGSLDPADPSLGIAIACDDTAVQLRHHERELVARFFAGLSAEARRRRFLQPMPRLPESILRRLVDVDSRRHIAVVATVDGECVGIARYVALADEPGTAEGGVSVADRYQGRGIGRLLVDVRRPAAVRAGPRTLVYLVDPTNRPALRLLRSLDAELTFRNGLVPGRRHLLADGPDPTTTREMTWATGTSA